jgi:hypothetical protein
VPIVVDGFRQNLSLKNGLKLSQDRETRRAINSAIFEEMADPYASAEFSVSDYDPELDQYKDPEQLSTDQVARYSFATDSVTLGLNQLVRFYQVLSDGRGDLAHRPRELIAIKRTPVIEDIAQNSKDGLYRLEDESSLSRYLGSLFYPEAIMESCAL